jgi:hypothetical protein
MSRETASTHLQANLRESFPQQCGNQRWNGLRFSGAHRSGDEKRTRAPKRASLINLDFRQFRWRKQ